MKTHHEEPGREAGMEQKARGQTLGVFPDDDPSEVAIACRTRSALPAEPDLISGKTLTVFDSRRGALDVTLGSKVTFNPGSAPQLCPISRDEVVLLPERSVNLAGAVLVAQLPGRLVFNLDAQDGERPVTLAFRLKFEEQRTQPKRAVLLATVDLKRRTVSLARG
jgi:hypothetical protein